jgi:hypothetical protein
MNRGHDADMILSRERGEVKCVRRWRGGVAGGGACTGAKHNVVPPLFF